MLLHLLIPKMTMRKFLLLRKKSSIQLHLWHDLWKGWIRIQRLSIQSFLNWKLIDYTRIPPPIIFLNTFCIYFCKLFHYLHLSPTNFHRFRVKVRVCQPENRPKRPKRLAASRICFQTLIGLSSHKSSKMFFFCGCGVKIWKGSMYSIIS